MGIWNLNMFFFFLFSQLLCIPQRDWCWKMLRVQWPVTARIVGNILNVEIHVFDRFSLSEFLINMIIFFFQWIRYFTLRQTHATIAIYSTTGCCSILFNWIRSRRTCIRMNGMSGTCRVSLHLTIFYGKGSFAVPANASAHSLFHISFTSANIAIAPDITREEKNGSFEPLKH